MQGADRRTSDFSCCVCHRSVPHEEGAPVGGLRSSLGSFLRDRHGPSPSDPRICKPCLYVIRTELLLAHLEEERGELTALELHAARKASGRATSRRSASGRRPSAPGHRGRRYP